MGQMGCAASPSGRHPRPDALLSGAKLPAHCAPHGQAHQRGSRRGSDAVSSLPPAAALESHMLCQFLTAKSAQVCAENMHTALKTATCKLSTADDFEHVDTANS
ncbi:TPA: hypothetical protein ACH3X1_005527 [Trebouxia sp. C0004]